MNLDSHETLKEYITSSMRNGKALFSVLDAEIACNMTKQQVVYWLGVIEDECKNIWNVHRKRGICLIEVKNGN